MLMTQEEIKSSVQWAANAEAPIDRDTQIKLMLTARERHAAVREQIRQYFKENKMS